LIEDAFVPQVVKVQIVKAQELADPCERRADGAG